MLVTIIRIPTPPAPDAARAMEGRFAERLPLVAGAPGFLGFELLRPVEGSGEYLSISRWASSCHCSTGAKSRSRPARTATCSPSCAWLHTGERVDNAGRRR